jgi:hypothetical protein
MNAMGLFQHYDGERSDSHQEKQRTGCGRKLHVVGTSPGNRQHRNTQGGKRAEQDECEDIQSETDVTSDEYAHCGGNSGRHERG